MKTKIAIFLFLLSASTVFSSSGFRENKGQFRNEFGQPSQAVQFLLHCKGFNVQLRKDGFSYDFYKNIQDSVILNRVDFVFENYNPHYTILRELPDEPYITTFVSDKKKPSFEKIIYSQFYPGIDLVFKRKNDNQFEYDFVISENGNINDIQFTINGAEIIAVEPTAITLQTPIALFKEWIPLSYDHRLKKIDVSYHEVTKNNFTFFYSGKAKKFTIDPTPQLIYATYSGDSWSINKAQFLENGDYIACGFTGLPLNLATDNSYQSQFSGQTNATLCRFDASNDLVWFTYFGDNITGAQDLFIQNGIIAMGGYSNSTALPAEDGFQPNFAGGFLDVFYAIFDESGNFIHCSYLGGSNEDRMESIVSISENVFAITGNTRSQNFPSENSNTTYSGGQDGFVTFFNISNGFCLYSSFFGGSLNETVRGIIPTQEGKYLFFGESFSQTLGQSGSSSLPNVLHSQNFNDFNDGIIGIISNDFALELIGFYGAEGGESFVEGNINSEGKLILLSREAGTTTPFTSNAQFTELGGTSDGLVVTIFNTTLNIEYCSLLLPLVYTEDLLITPDNFIFIGGWTTQDENVATEGAFQEQRLEYPFNNFIDNDGFVIKLNSEGYKLWCTYFGEYPSDFIRSLDLLNNKLLVAGEIGVSVDYPEEYQYSFITSDAFQSQLFEAGGYIAIFDDVVNVNELNSVDERVLVYPNPALENIFVDADLNSNPLYFINDIAGKRVLEGNLNTSSIHISQLQKGMYTLTLQYNEQFKTAKFVKQ